CIIVTGCSDNTKQVNNVVCFPFIFRGAFDSGATEINEEMKMAAVHAIAQLAHEEAYDAIGVENDDELSFGSEYIIPRPFDPRLIVRVASAVAKAAEETGVARRAITDMEAYRQ